MLEAKLLIGGELVGASDGGEIDSIDPVNEAVIGRAADATPEDIADAVAAGETAGEAWASRSVLERAGYLRELAAAIKARHEEILDVEVRDTGNLRHAMHGDVERAAQRMGYFAGLGPAMTGLTYPATASHMHLTERQPFGVCARIVAFNHPFYFGATRLAAPLIAGNTVVLKSPDQAPLSSGILAEICQKVLPAGVVNIVHGRGPRAGDALVRHPKVKRIGFIGSVPTALAITRASAEASVKTITHELGGKNLMVVMPDADVEEAARMAVEGMNFQWQGQSCGSTSCLMLHADIYDAVLERVVERVKAIRLGDPSDPETGMGPLISAAHHAKVTAAIEAGKAAGARLLAGGGRPSGARFEKGYWVEPTVFADVDPTGALARNEIFGPVLSVLSWRDPAEVVAIDKASDLGLTASVIGKDIGMALSFARRLQVGYVWVNCVGPHYPGVPYGGFKNSGSGREEGLEEILSYTEIKAINIAVPGFA